MHRFQPAAAAAAAAGRLARPKPAGIAARALSTSGAALSDEALTYSKYPFLKELGLGEDNVGCFDGKKWEANGPMHTAVNPSTNEPIARVQWGNTDDYERCLENMEEASLLYTPWAASPRRCLAPACRPRYG